MPKRNMSEAPEPTRFVQQVFSEVPATYELVNHVLTFGLDTVWRRRAARTAAKRAKGGVWVDMCSGTGETAMYLGRLAKEDTSLKVVDFSHAMLAEARKKPELARSEFVIADIKSLPFSDKSVDLITMSFATRNINLSKSVLTESFSELYRVLKSGGCFVNLETSQPSSSIIRRCFHFYIRLCVRQIGGRISRSKIGYAYLSQTIPRFYEAETLAGLMREAGFQRVTISRLFFGVAAIHVAERASSTLCRKRTH